MAVLQALGLPLSGPDDVEPALRQQTEARWRWDCEPVVVAWDGHPGALPLRLPQGASARIECSLQREGGDSMDWTAEAYALPVTAHSPGDVECVEVALQLPSLPEGYHQLHVRARSGRRVLLERQVLVLSARTRLYEHADGRQRLAVFLPLYALRTARTWGAGDYSDLAALCDWLAGQGGDVVATLPLLPTFLDNPFLPSPYSPVSRLFWSDFYVDPRAAPGFANCRPATEFLDQPATRAEVERLRGLELVDYRAQSELKRRLLQALADTAFAGRSDGGALRRFLARRPDVEEYARFRAVMRQRGQPWQRWPEALRPGALPVPEDDETYRYHAYAQWLAEEQLSSLAERARSRRQEFYLDLPVGSHPDGYDTWRFRDVFANSVSVGAPPDALFAGGQVWGFPPLDPVKLRRSGYEFWLRVLRHHLRLASVLRVDHVFGLHRLFWVPHGMPATQGVYLRYPAAEFYAMFSIESHRRRATIVGENLGTAPRNVSAAMARHRLYETYVLQFAVQTGPGGGVQQPSRTSYAGLNTHDMPPFAGWLGGRDIVLRRELGFTDEATAAAELAHRGREREALYASLRSAGFLGANTSPAAVLRATMRFLRAGPARYVALNLEDAWQETEAQNLPGTGEEHPNWRRRARRKVEEFPALSGGPDTVFG